MRNYLQILHCEDKNVNNKKSGHYSRLISQNLTIFLSFSFKSLYWPIAIVVYGPLHYAFQIMVSPYVL